MLQKGHGGARCCWTKGCLARCYGPLCRRAGRGGDARARGDAGRGVVENGVFGREGAVGFCGAGCLAAEFLIIYCYSFTIVITELCLLIAD